VEIPIAVVSERYGEQLVAVIFLTPQKTEIILRGVSQEQADEIGRVLL
jgi:hypothetical protein